MREFQIPGEQMKSTQRQARSSTDLESAVVAIVLIVQVFPVLAADSVTLSCRVEGSTETHTYRINYATKLVEELGPSGQAWTNRTAPDARISDNAIVWSADLLDTGLQKPRPMHWEGAIDRLSGTGSTWWSRDGLVGEHTEHFTCNEATKPKF